MSEDNLIHMKIKHVEGEQEYQNLRLDNISDDVRRIANIQLPNLNNDINRINNNITSLTELFKLRDDKMNNKLECIESKLNSIVWGGILFSFAIIVCRFLL